MWLITENAPSSFTVEWRSTNILPASIQFKQNISALVRRKTLVLYPMEANGRYGKALAETAIEPILEQWLAGDADGRAALVAWALWAGGLREL